MLLTGFPADLLWLIRNLRVPACRKDAQQLVESMNLLLRKPSSTGSMDEPKGIPRPVGGEEVAAEWSTGNVGMHGTSYNGTLPLAAATTGVDGLKAIIPVAPNTSYWHYYRSYGLVRHPGGYLGEDIDVLYDFIHSQKTDRRDYCNDTVRDGGNGRRPGSHHR